MIDIPDRWLPRWRSTMQSRVVCWEIIRQDGVTYRFTSWDQPIWIGPKKFLPRDEEVDDIDERGGGKFTGETRQASLKEHAAGLSGILSSASIKDVDLHAGKFEKASVVTYMLDARETANGFLSKAFTVADTQWSTDGFWRISLVSAIDSALQTQRGELVSRTCRNALFDAKCARARTFGQNNGLVADEWEIGQTSGSYCVVSQVTDDFTIRVQIPAATIVDSGPRAGTDSYVTFSSNHYFCGETAASARAVHPRVLIYSYSASSPDLNGYWENITTGDPPFAGISIIVPGEFTASSTGASGFACLAPEADWFQRGQLVWATGNNLGTGSVVASSSEFVASPTTGFGGYVDITLDAASRRTIQVGDQLTLIAGCDKRIDTCEGRFANLPNFNGEPYTPSSDVILYSPSSR